ncbi:hypothetical protein Bbelb_234100 [Branchiostoma belcheri]|nr:hypothetical protein Bbelb_234100 [Branchiostoma belcheri]
MCLLRLREIVTFAQQQGEETCADPCNNGLGDGEFPVDSEDHPCGLHWRASKKTFSAQDDVTSRRDSIIIENRHGRRRIQCQNVLQCEADALLPKACNARLTAGVKTAKARLDDHARSQDFALLEGTSSAVGARRAPKARDRSVQRTIVYSLEARLQSLHRPRGPEESLLCDMLALKPRSWPVVTGPSDSHCSQDGQGWPWTLNRDISDVITGDNGFSTRPCPPSVRGVLLW